VTLGSPPRQARLGPNARVWLLSASLAAVAVALVFSTRLEGPLLRLNTAAVWIAVTVAFAASEIWVVHVQFRREAHTISLSEIPLTVGLFFIAPWALVLAQACGVAAALALHRRQSPVKLGFNLAQMALSTAFAVVVFHAAIGRADPLGPRAWLVAGTATACASLVGIISIRAAISVTEGRIRPDKLLEVTLFSLVGTFVNTSLALVGVVTIYRDARAGVLLLLPATALYIAYQAYTRERQKTERMEFLYNTGRTLAGTGSADNGIVQLLEGAVEMFRAEVAEVWVRTAPGDSPGSRTRVRSGQLAEVEAIGDGEYSEGLLEEIMSTDRGAIVDLRQSPPGARRFLERHGLRDAVLTSLKAENRVVGAILVGNRLGNVSGFTPDHLNLLETVATQVGAAVENARLERVLQHQAFHDALTNLPNRALLNERTETALARPGSGVAMLLVDLDDFKVINDTMGHSVGDQLLVAVAARLERAVRDSDTPARVGGDEFAVLVENMSADGDATAAAHRVIEALRQPFDLAGQKVAVSASIGISTNIGGLLDPGALMLQADVAMYAAKAADRGGYRVFEPSMQDEVAERHALRDDLRRALERGELVNHYQPLLALEGHAVLGMEALVRWRHPDRGLIAPGFFIRLAEESGLIVQLGRWVLREACRQLAEWQRLRPAWPLGVSVNLSAVQLRQDGFVDEVVGILKATGLDARSLTLEITESTFMDDTRTAIARLRELRGLGIRLELDDFGTGFSSLSLLRDLPLDGLKIDKSFVDGIRTESDRPVFLQAIVRMAEALDLEMVGEGVEEAHQAEALRAMGVQRGQGYLFSRPLPAEDMGAYLRRSVSLADAEDPAVVRMPARRRSD
jgi:diguanylate cyclase (GGDEF)-like protein